jgi:hypothetical protein
MVRMVILHEVRTGSGIHVVAFASNRRAKTQERDFPRTLLGIVIEVALAIAETALR